MPIYDIFEHVEKHLDQEDQAAEHIHLSKKYSELTLGREELPAKKSSIFSSIAARLFFFILFLTDIGWGLLSTGLFLGSLILNAMTLFKVPKLNQFFLRRYLNIKRAFICGFSLFVALFSPALGTMFACTYFLMYDKKGVEEVVPSILQDQFKEFFPS